jgi:hypothetical protein
MGEFFVRIRRTVTLAALALAAVSATIAPASAATPPRAHPVGGGWHGHTLTDTPCRDLQVNRGRWSIACTTAAGGWARAVISLDGRRVRIGRVAFSVSWHDRYHDGSGPREDVVLTHVTVDGEHVTPPPGFTADLVLDSRAHAATWDTV